MNKLRQAILLALGTELPNREIGRSLQMNYNTIRRYRQVAADQQYQLEELRQLDDDALYQKFHRHKLQAPNKVMPDWRYVHAEFQKEDVTLQLLWEEYRKPYTADGAYSYTQFTHYYRKWAAKNTVRMRLVHAPGDRGFVDFAGRTIPWVDASTGEIHQAQIFVSALGYSSYVFATAVATAGVVGRVSSAMVRAYRRRARNVRAGQFEIGSDSRRQRPGVECNLSPDGRLLWHGDPSGAAAPTEGQIKS